MRHASTLALSAAALLIGGAALAEPGSPQVEFAIGADWSTGRYGGRTDTEILYAPLTARVQGTAWKFEAVVPWLQIEGAGTAIGGPGGPVVVRRGSETRLSGLGDVTLGASWLSPQLGVAGPYLELKGHAKLPTARDGLGTGKTDWSAQLELLQPVGSRLTLILSGGYQWLGDSPTLPLENGAMAAAGFSLRTAAGTDLGVLYDWRATALAGTDDQKSLVPFVSWRLAHVGVMAYGVAGLSDSSPDWGAGLQFSVYR